MGSPPASAVTLQGEFGAVNSVPPEPQLLPL